MAQYSMVVAIDFGTTYAGYGFSTRAEYLREPLKVHANQIWNSGKKQLLSLKTPTCLLLNKTKELVAFGYEAEDAYAELVLDNKHKDYYYFEKFKMKLYDSKDLTEDLKLTDAIGKVLPATEVFGQSIKALTGHFIELQKTEGTDVNWTEIRWVLTVPAIWDDRAKQFMRTCAEKADIPPKNLVIALEPEAASIYCQYLPKDRLLGTDASTDITKPGVKYIVVDLGGGTADMAVHEKGDDERINEICRVHGDSCGGTSVDNEFIGLIDKVFGFPLMCKLKKEDPSSYLDLLREFEALKRKVDITSTEKVNLCIPYSTINTICKKQFKGKSLESVVQSSTLKKQVSLRGDKIRLDAELIKSLFVKTCTRIVTLVNDVTGKLGSAEIPIILMVGGFSECRIIQTAIKEAFPTKRVIVPEEAGISVLKGAVLYGHNPGFVASRVLKYTYGTNIYVDFDPQLHDDARKEVLQEEDKCEVFDFIIQQNTHAVIGSEIQRSYFTLYPYQTAMPITLYVSTRENPKYVDEEGCSKFGEVVVDIPNPSEEKRTVLVTFNFGKTEIIVTAREMKFGAHCKTRLKLL